MPRVTPYDIGRFWVESDSGEEPYLVDVLSGGGCDCVDFRIRVSGLRKKTTCKHLLQALEVWHRDFSPDERAAIVRQQTKPREPRQPFT